MRTPIILLAATLVQSARPDSMGRVWIEGGSNVADWSCRAIAFDAAVDSSLSRVTVRLSARDLKCGNRKMDHDLYAALKSADPAAPTYIVASFEAASAAERQPGLLSVAGIERRVEARVTTERGDEGFVHARGSVPLRMTDFGEKPPVGLFGLIRSKNDVVVRFDLVIS